MFVGKDFVTPIEVNENLCKSFRYLLDNYHGETPLDYYARFKLAFTAATTDGYYLHNPTEKVSVKLNPSCNRSKGIIEFSIVSHKM